MKIITRLLHKYSIRLLFGPRAKGEYIPKPSLKTLYPDYRPDLVQWSKDYNFGARYGHRGSFYTHANNMTIVFR